LLFVPINEPAGGIDSLPEIGIADRSLDDQIDRIAKDFLKRFRQTEVILQRGRSGLERDQEIKIASARIKPRARRRTEHFEPLDVKTPADFANRFALSISEWEHQIVNLAALRKE